MPLVTVVALCYNHCRFLTETLTSIRNQNYTNLEVIIVDDFSTDESVRYIEKWLIEEGVSWCFIRHKENVGICKSLNEILDVAKGKYFKIIACDDVLMPDFIRTMVERFEFLSDDFAMIYSDVLTINEYSEVFGTSPFSERGWDTDEKVPSGKLFNQLAGWCFVPAPGTFLRTQVLKEIRFDESLMFEDWDMWLQIAKRYKIDGLAQAMAKYRIHNASMFQQKSPAFRDHELRTLEKHLGHSQVGDEIINNFIYNQSIILYLNNGDRPEYWLKKRFLHRKTIRNLFKYLIAVAKSRIS
jgi:glycosyltransferase involved in cell wall biosynthesis